MIHKDKPSKPVEPAEPAPTTAATGAPADAAGDAAQSQALTEPPEEAVARLEGELAALKDKYLRLAAEYDNFRKRAQKERTEVWGRAQADLVQRLVDALDDLARFAHVDPAQTEGKTLHDGVNMVERKMWKQLEAAGVSRVDQIGIAFDPTRHEAVTTGVADTPAQDHTIGAVLQPGYVMAGTLLRPARVQVLQWPGAAGRGAGDQA